MATKSAKVTSKKSTAAAETKDPKAGPSPEPRGPDSSPPDEATTLTTGAESSPPKETTVPQFYKGKPHQQVLYGNAQGRVRFIQDHNCFDNEGKYVCHEDDRK